MQGLGRWLWPLIAAAALVSLVANRGFRRLAANALAIRRLDQRVQVLSKEEIELHSQIERLKRDDQTLESAARKELGFLKPGEVEYRFPPPKR
jgi:cell division protein FtsB